MALDAYVQSNYTVTYDVRDIHLAGSGLLLEGEESWGATPHGWTRVPGCRERLHSHEETWGGSTPPPAMMRGARGGVVASVLVGVPYLRRRPCVASPREGEEARDALPSGKRTREKIAHARASRAQEGRDAMPRGTPRRREEVVCDLGVMRGSDRVAVSAARWTQRSGPRGRIAQAEHLVQVVEVQVLRRPSARCGHACPTRSGEGDAQSSAALRGLCAQLAERPDQARVGTSRAEIG